MKTYYLTDAGKVRNHNEDSVTIVKNNNNEYLMVVADGMGGHRAGEIASSIAVDHLSKNFIELDTVGEKSNAVNWIRKHVDIINDEIIKYSNKNSGKKGMGSTLVLALLTREYVLFGNLGDSSGYVTKDNKLHKVTKDHTLVNLLVTTGELSQEEAKEHPQKNILMRALGANAPAEIDIFDVDTDIQSIMLCSDGVTSMLNSEQLEFVLTQENLSVEQKVQRLIKKCNNRGGTDNISIAYLEKESGELDDS